MQTPMDKTLPYTDSSSPVKPIEASIGKLHKEVTEHFRSLNNDRARIFAHEFIQKYIKTQRIKSLDTKINVRNFYPLLIQQSSVEAVNFYEFLLISGYAEESDVDIHLLHAAVVGSQRFVLFILENVPAVQLELPKQLAAKQGHIEIFLMLIKRKRQKEEVVVNDSLDLSLSPENFLEDSINPYIDQSIGEKHSIFTSSPNTFKPNLFTESPIPMVKGSNYNNLESPSLFNSTSTSFDNSEEIGSFDRLMMQAVESQDTEDEDLELQQQVQLVDAQATDALKRIEMALKENNFEQNESVQESQNEDFKLQQEIKRVTEQATRVSKALEMALLEEGYILDEKSEQSGSFDLQQRMKLADEQATEILKKLEEVIKGTNVTLGMMESSTDVLEDTKEDVATPISDVYSPVKFLIASISPFKPPRSPDSTYLKELKLKSSKIGLAPPLNLDQELYQEEENDNRQSLAGLNRFGTFKDAKGLKKDSETINLSPR